jgi:voltage-gated potassium channel
VSPRAPATRTPTRASWRDRLYVIIFEADTPAGKAFDVALLWTIVASVAAVMLETVAGVRAIHGSWLLAVEWAFTLLFSVEYGLRLSCAKRPGAYARSFFGLVDLLAIAPTYVSLLIPGTQSLLVIRALRLLRIFRVLKLGSFLGEMGLLMTALRESRAKVVVFLGIVLILVLILGSAMYLIEGEAGGFTSIPVGVYWAIVTMTTVGYGDIAPQTWVGQLLASAVMILGYSIIAVPTGIVTAGIVEAATRRPLTTRVCPGCMTEGHERGARYCKDCGVELEGA